MRYLLEGLIYRGEFAFQNPTGLANSWTEIYVIVLFLLYLFSILGQFLSISSRGLLFGGAI